MRVDARHIFRVDGCAMEEKDFNWEGGGEEKRAARRAGSVLFSCGCGFLADAPGRAPPDSEPRGIMQRQRPHPTSPSRPLPQSNLLESAGARWVGVDEADGGDPESGRPLSDLPGGKEDQSVLKKKKDKELTQF